MEAFLIILFFVLLILMFNLFNEDNSLNNSSNSDSKPTDTTLNNSIESNKPLSTIAERRKQEYEIAKKQHQEMQAEQARKKSAEAARIEQENRLSVHIAKQSQAQAEAQIRAEVAKTEKERAFEEYLQRQEIAATQALEKKLAAEWEAKQKQIAEQTEKLRLATLAQKKKLEREREEKLRETERLAEKQRTPELKHQLELCEVDTSYYYDIDATYHSNPYGFSLSTIRSLSYDCGVFDELERGKAQLTTSEQLIQYVFSYGMMHKAKLHQSFEALVDNEVDDFDLNGHHIEVIDYGCGQGIGTVGFIDFLKSFPNFHYTIEKVKLIEPSLLALKRASLHTRYSLKSINQLQAVQCINKDLDSITASDLACRDFTVKFHLFSNILDIEEIDLLSLCNKIANTFKGDNYFICVSPNFSPNATTLHWRNERLDLFRNYFQDRFATSMISSRIDNIGNWTRFERVFKVDFDRELKNDNKVKVKFSAKELIDLYAPKRKVVEMPDDLPF